VTKRGGGGFSVQQEKNDEYCAASCWMCRQEEAGNVHSTGEVEP
jgi:hypothetical protein